MLSLHHNEDQSQVFHEYYASIRSTERYIIVKTKLVFASDQVIKQKQPENEALLKHALQDTLLKSHPLSPLLHLELLLKHCIW